ncbi:MAG: DUF4230 domain-containing protein [Prevotella sp.]|nr:DUF4230 domain-containing protein [Prevotella sp.]
MIKNFIRIYKVQIALFVAIAIAVIFVFVVLARTVRSAEMAFVSDGRIDVTPEQIESIRAIGEWEFLSVSDEEMVDTVRRGFFSDDRLARIYYGTMRLGIDMRELTSDRITVSGDTVTILMPPIRLLDDNFIDEARTRAFHESGRWSADDREAMYRRAAARMKQKGLTQENIRSAETNADVQLRDMMKAMGFATVVVRFSPRRK